MTIARFTTLAATGAAAAIALTACSSSGSSGSPTSTPPAAKTSSSPQQQAAGSGRSVTATETEFNIALSTKTFSAGTWTFKVKNSGSITHAFTVDGPGVQDKSTGDISPGSSATLTVTMKPGKYEIFCPIGNHKMEGMDENVTVS